MPQFFFHLRTLQGLDADDIGLELADAETAYLCAYEAIPTMSADYVQQAHDPRQFEFEITDKVGRVLFELPFTEALEHRPTGRLLRR
ncbi:DUF6894 family protein [Methylobacterium oxalidis]|nr:hypothetical protein [Methylobacterium oxalidis]GJE33701.1 hypothetical protein LDDCCGHA_3904 [Methylobacterium oxalidis]GLS62277.1 hypothetical protein GCM10007888_06580 [Methylobacterium oxalidis]